MRKRGSVAGGVPVTIRYARCQAKWLRSGVMLLFSGGNVTIHNRILNKQHPRGYRPKQASVTADFGLVVLVAGESGCFGYSSRIRIVARGLEGC